MSLFGIDTIPAPLDPLTKVEGAFAALIGIPAVSYFLLWPWRG